MKYLIAGLGNIGAEYDNTRHNIGFNVADLLVQQAGGSFTLGRLANTATIRVKNKILVVIKPTTYMNLSGKAIRYYLTEENILVQNMLVVTDDLALPFGTLRLKGNGSDGGHNGLKSIQDTLQSNVYARLRFGIGADFPKGRQSDYVLGQWTADEMKDLQPRVERAVDIVKSFALEGIQNAMNKYNNK